MIPVFLQVVLIFVTLVNATTLIREEIDDNTLPYLLTRPISKPAVVMYKYIGYLVAVLVLLVPPIVLAYGVTEAYQGTGLSSDLDVLGGFLVTTVIGSAAYGAVFLFISVIFRKPLAVGLLFGFVWESIVGAIPGDVPKLSLMHYLKSVFAASETAFCAAFAKLTGETPTTSITFCTMGCLFPGIASPPLGRFGPYAGSVLVATRFDFRGIREALEHRRELRRFFVHGLHVFL